MTTPIGSSCATMHTLVLEEVSSKKVDTLFPEAGSEVAKNEETKTSFVAQNEEVATEALNEGTEVAVSAPAAEAEGAEVAEEASAVDANPEVGAETLAVNEEKKSVPFSIQNRV